MHGHNDSVSILNVLFPEFVRCLHVKESNVRVGYVPYNTDVYQSFDLDMYGDVDAVINGIGKMTSLWMNIACMCKMKLGSNMKKLSLHAKLHGRIQKIF